MDASAPMVWKLTLGTSQEDIFWVNNNEERVMNVHESFDD